MGPVEERERERERKCEEQLSEEGEDKRESLETAAGGWMKAGEMTRQVPSCEMTCMHAYIHK